MKILMISALSAALLLGAMFGALLSLSANPSPEDRRTFCGASGYFSKC